MERLKRAIIVAAGEGKRLRPVTLETPKPLVSVNGTRLIDTSVSALKKNGINEIIIVAGYKREQFHAAFADDPTVTVIDNPYYDQGNNITSLYMAKEYIPGSFILEADLIVRNPDILNPETDCSGYLVSSVEETDDWAVKVQNGKITYATTTGGRDLYRMWGISMWTKEQGMLLQELVRQRFEDMKDWSVYWDDLALFIYPERFDLGVRQVEYSDIQEIDTVEELAAMDPVYGRYLKDII